MDGLGVTLLRQLEPSDVRCPAGVLTGDASIHCNVEDHTLQGYKEPDSIESYCCGEYTTCPTFLAMKEVEDRGGDIRRILRSMKDKNRERRLRQDLRDARLRRAQRLMLEDSAEGRAFRKRLKVGEFDPDIGGRG